MFKIKEQTSNSQGGYTLPKMGWGGAKIVELHIV